MQADGFRRRRFVSGAFGLAAVAVPSTAQANNGENLKAQDTFQVKDPVFGAKGDGVTDDSRSWRDALAAASGKTLYVPAGTYRLASNITIPANTTLVLEAGAALVRAAGVGITNNGRIISYGGCGSDLSGATIDRVRGFLVDQRNGSGAIHPTEYHALDWNRVSVLNDAVDVCAGVNGQTKSNGHIVEHTFGGPGMTGGRHSIYGVARFTAQSSAANPDRNYVAIQGHAVAGANDNGTPAGKQGALFGLASVAHLGARATHFLNVTACELNTRVEAGTTPGYRSGVQIASRDLDRGATYDCMVGLSDISSNADGLWTNGILIGPMNSQHPLRSTGTILKTTGSSTVSTGIDVSSYTITDAVLKSSKVNLQDGFMFLTDTDSGIEVGNPAFPNSPFMDFRSGGHPVDYDARIQASGGDGAAGNGVLSVTAAALQAKQIRPFADNSFSLGNGSLRWSEVYAANGTINTSDARKKENLQRISAAQAERFLAALNPVSYRFKDYAVPQAVTTRIMDVAVMREEKCFEDRIETGPDGVQRVVRAKATRKVPVTEAIPLVDEMGRPVMEEFIRYAVNDAGKLIEGADGKPIAVGMGRRPAVKHVPVTEKKPVAQRTCDAMVKTHKRTHWGLIAQDVEKALAACGITSQDFGGFVFDAEADMYGLRYDQFIAPLIAVVQGLSERVRQLEAAASA